MSRLNDLIAELAPDGVELMTIGEVCTVFNGFAFKSAQFNTDGAGLPLIRIRDVNTGFSDTFYSGEYDNRWLVEDGDVLIGMDGDFRASRWRHGRALLNQRVCRLQEFSSRVDPGFVYYVVQRELDRIHASIAGSTVKHLSSRELERSRIPVPPIAVQEEVVRVLDAYTDLERELAVALRAEMKARQLQYAHYRDSLLAGVVGPRTAMGDVGSFIRGRRFTKSDVVEVGVPSIHYGEIYTDYGVSASRAIREVRSDLADRLRFAQPRDVIFAGVGETVEDVGKAVAWLGDGPVAVHDDTFSFTSDVNPKYIAYAVQTGDFNAQKANYVARGKVKRLSATGLAKIRIPIPTAQEQERIVSILDELETLLDGLNRELPKELIARRKQYDYHRERLLAFQEAVA